MSNDDLSGFATTTSVEEGTLGEGASGPIIHGIAWFAVLALLFFVVPRFESVFNDFGVDLPQLTKLAVKASHLVVKFALLLGPLVVVLMVLDGKVLAALRQKGDVGQALAWSAFMMAVPLVVPGGYGWLVGIGLADDQDPACRASERLIGCRSRCFPVKIPGRSKKTLFFQVSIRYDTFAS